MEETILFDDLMGYSVDVPQVLLVAYVNLVNGVGCYEIGDVE
jgi:hypothetical protein